MKRMKTAVGIAGAALAFTICTGCVPTAMLEPSKASVTAIAKTAPVPATPIPAVRPPAITLAPCPTTTAEADTGSGKLLDVPLNPETQAAIFGMTGGDKGLFCLLMAIAETESDFDPYTAGDDGGSLGIFQINVKWHLDRMERLGVSDLTNPAQCAAVAVDYIQELVIRYGFAPESHELLMAYNMGPGGARKALNKGTTETDYSREVMRVYRGFLNELEG